MKPKNVEKGATRRSRGAVTIDRVAKLAEVSPMTVSRVLRGSAHVREATRERVTRAVHTLGYVPNPAASSLASARDQRIALIYTNPSDAYLRELLLGAIHAAAGSASQLVIEDWGTLSGAARNEALQALARSVSGVILPPPLGESRAVINGLVEANIPVVAVASARYSRSISSVHIDDYAASLELVQYLIDLGHTRIACIKGNPNQSASAHRFEGYRAALRGAGLEVREQWVQQGLFTYRSGLAAAQQLLTLRTRPSAIFAADDDMAAAVISVAHQRGLKVPGDLSVVGFDDTAIATTVWPELTTVRQPISDMTGVALEILLRAVHKPPTAPKVITERVVPYKLIIRGSSARPSE